MHRLLAMLAFVSIAVSQDWTPVSGFYTGAGGFDPVRGRLVRVGFDGSTWEWDGTDWFLRAARVPSGYQPGEMVFDRVRNVLVARSWLGLLTWDGEQWSPMPAPPGGTLQMIVYDDNRARLVALTGVGGPAETWEHDGVQWTRVVTANAPPMPIFGSFMPSVYDGISQRVMLLQGSSSGTGGFDMWSYDGIDWSLLVTTTPSYRLSPSFGYDPLRGRIVLYGGFQGAPTPLTDVWEWDGIAWTLITGSSGMDSSWAPMCFDARHGHLLMLPFFREMQRWTGTAWVAVAQPWRAINRISTEPLLGKPIGISNGETWEWDSRRWVLTAAGQPGLQDLVSQANGAVIGVSTRTVPGAFLWAGSWVPMQSPTTGLPPVRSEFAATFDTVRNRIVLFGGQDTQGHYLADTWEWDGNLWFQVATARAPSPRYRAKMVFDPLVHMRTLLVGGEFVAGNSQVFPTDTWAYDGVNWTLPSANATPFVQPGFEHAFALRFDAASFLPAATWIHAGLVSEYRHNGTDWSWIGDTPTALTTGGNLQLAFEPTRGTALAFDGVTLLRLPTVASSATATGNACGASLRLGVRTAPVIGQTPFGFDLRGAAGAALVGVSTASASLPLGGGCTLYLQGLDALFAAVANSGGFAEILIPIPDDPALRGFTVFAQAAQLDPASAIGIAASRLLTVTVGN